MACIVPDVVGRLRRQLGSISTWKKITAKELEEYRAQTADQHNPLWDEYVYDPLLEEEISLYHTERDLFACLAVSIASAAENFIIRVCKNRNIPLTDSDGESDFGIICNNLSSATGMKISSLPGYTGNQRARLLGNCFKHNDGDADSRFSKKYDTAEGQPIEYEKLNWDEMIVDTEKLLYELANRI